MKSFGAEGLAKAFKKKKVVDGVSLQVEGRSITGLLGPNGAGKTTTFYMLTGLIRGDSGRVYLQGDDITALPMYERARRGVGYLPQEPSVFRKLTVEENILAILEFIDAVAGERKLRANRLLEELGLSHLRHTMAYMLSGGERRRVEIARALTGSPSFLLLDEPFSGIDPIAVNDIQQIVIGLKDKGIGVLITDHNVSATLGICDKAYIIDKGRILMSGTPEEIVKSKEVREAYLGNNFRL